MSLISKDDHDDAIQALEFLYEELGGGMIDVKRTRVANLIAYLKLQKSKITTIN